LSTEEQRLDYPLGPESVVLDVGAYVGHFTRDVFERFGCSVIAFEPVPEFYKQMPASWRTAEAMTKHGPVAYNYGLGAKTERVRFKVRNDSSGRNRDAVAEDDQEVLIREVAAVFGGLDLGNVDLMKINIEGDEYDLLDRMLDVGLVARIRYLQIQFHSCGAGQLGPVKRRALIRAGLAKTHLLQWEWSDCWPTSWSWESWKRLP
jgi:FkbM family methyltransferase